MEFKFDEVFSPPPIIQNKKKYATFTVREIGGPAELAKWKVEQAAKWDAYQAERSAKREKMKQFIAGPEAPQGDGVTWTGKGMTEGFKDLDKGNWKEKLEQVMSERKRLAAPIPESEQVIYPPYVPEPEPKQTWFQRVKAFILNIWKTANF
jgi:hypothetical protein